MQKSNGCLGRETQMNATSSSDAHLVEIYNLADDREHIRKVQRATLNTTDYGLVVVPEHGLFGSEQWWEAIRTGKLPTVRIEGVITRVYMGSMNDWPEFEIESGGGKTTWTRHANRPGAYVVRKRVRLDYVLQHAKKDLGNLGTTEDKVVLRIAVEP